MDETTQSPGLTGKKRFGNSRNSPESLSLDDIRRLILLKYGSEASFSRKLGWTRSTGSRLLNGLYIPHKREVIERIAKELGIDQIVLTQLFERLRNKPDFVTADSLESDIQPKN